MNIKYRDAALAKLITITALLAFACLNSTAQFQVQEPKQKVFHSRIGGDWLRVIRVNQADDPDTWHPSFVAIRSDYRPVVVKHSDYWEINFRSPNLPEPDLP